MSDSVNRTPRRLVQLFKAIRIEAFDASMKEMAVILNGVVRWDDDTPLIVFNEQTVKNIESRRIQTTYLHIESYANLFGVPAGVLLLISRFQHDSPENIEKTLRSMTDVLLRVTEYRGLISQRQLRLIAERLGTTSTSNQSLPPVLRSPGRRRPATTHERLVAIKQEQDRNRVNTTQDLALWRHLDQKMEGDD